MTPRQHQGRVVAAYALIAVAVVAVLAAQGGPSRNLVLSFVPFAFVAGGGLYLSRRLWMARLERWEILAATSMGMGAAIVSYAMGLSVVFAAGVGVQVGVFWWSIARRWGEPPGS